MTREEQEFVPTTYEIRIKGHLDKRWADWFGGMTFNHESAGTTSVPHVTDRLLPCAQPALPVARREPR
jgi:hypothetical protein